MGDVDLLLIMQVVIQMDPMVDVVQTTGMSLFLCCLCDACGASTSGKANSDDWTDTAALHLSSEYSIILEPPGYLSHRI